MAVKGERLITFGVLFHVTQSPLIEPQFFPIRIKNTQALLPYFMGINSLK